MRRRLHALAAVCLSLAGCGEGRIRPPDLDEPFGYDWSTTPNDLRRGVEVECGYGDGRCAAFAPARDGFPPRGTVQLTFRDGRLVMADAKFSYRIVPAARDAASEARAAETYRGLREEYGAPIGQDRAARHLSELGFVTSRDCFPAEDGRQDVWQVSGKTVVFYDEVSCHIDAVMGGVLVIAAPGG